MISKMESHRRAGVSPATLLLGIAALLGAAGAVSPLADAQEEGTPQRAVRLSYVDGKVMISQNNQVVTDQAVANSPLLQGMTLSTADDGRAEVQFEDGSVARISPDSSLTLRVLEGQGTASQTEIDVDKGLAYFELQENGQAGPMSIRFGDAVVTGSGFTILRIKNDVPPGDVAVFAGNAHLERSSGLQLDIPGGQEAALSDTDPNGYNLAETIEQDSWDAWNSDRDQALNAEQAAQTGAPGAVTGGQDNNPAWSDLDANGTWYNVPDQGYVWSPYDASNPDFDPYGNGNWVWTPTFGYIWVSAYSWGYMPYQCGSWNYYNGFGWGWAPGFGGCRPWWSAGFYAGPVIGFAPHWYHRVERPRLPHDRWRPGHPAPVIGVHRHPEVFTAGLPRRDHDTPVAINGRTVMAMRTMPARSNFGRAAFGTGRSYPNHMPEPGTARGSAGTSGSVGARTMPGRRNVYEPQRPGYTPRQGYQGGQPGDRGGQSGSHGAQPGSGAQPGWNAGQPAPRNEQPGWNSRPMPPQRTYTPPAQNAPQAPRNDQQPNWNSRPMPPQRTYTPPAAPQAPNTPQAPRNDQQPNWNSRPAPTPRTYTPPPAPPAHNEPQAPRTYSPPAPRGGGGFSGGGGSHGGGAPSGGGGGGFHGGGAPSGGGGNSGGGHSGGSGNSGGGGHH